MAHDERASWPAGRSSTRRRRPPLHEQIERSIRERHPRRPPRRRRALPSTRALAAELGVSRGVVTRGLRPARGRGLPADRPGRAGAGRPHGARAPAPRRPARSLLPSFAYDFNPGLPDLAGFPRDRWLRSLRAAWRQAPIDAVGYPDPRGVPALREALAEYLGRVRGAAADPEHLLDLHRLRPGPLADLPLAARPRRRAGRARGPRLAPAPADRRSRPGSRSCRSRSTARGCGSTRSRRAGPPRWLSPPRTSSRPGGAQQRAAGGADRVGGAGRAADRRGRLRRRAPLRPRRRRRPAGPRAGARRLHRLGEQAAGARACGSAGC